MVDTVLLEVVRERALKDAARDVCMYCGRRAKAEPLSGPNSAGNYVHGEKLCPATSIWSRIRFEFSWKPGDK